MWTGCVCQFAHGKSIFFFFASSVDWRNVHVWWDNKKNVVTNFEQTFSWELWSFFSPLDCSSPNTHHGNASLLHFNFNFFSIFLCNKNKNKFSRTDWRTCCGKHFSLLFVVLEDWLRPFDSLFESMRAICYAHSLSHSNTHTHTDTYTFSIRIFLARNLTFHT